MNHDVATDAYVALGSNLGDSHRILVEAMDALDAWPGNRLVAKSRVYRTPPWGVTDQPDFLNAAVRLRTSLSPQALLDALMEIERQAGRVRDGVRWGPRTLDLDLLHVEGVVVADDRLCLPHPRIAERAFVLLPLAELAPTLVLPGQGRVDELMRRIDTQGCVPLS